MKIIKIGILIFLILVLCMTVYYKYIEERPLIKIFGLSCLIVATGSMEPAILSEELIIIAEKQKYEKGDVVTYIDEENFIITHRILDIDSNKFIAKGDANNVNDEVCNTNRIQGKVIYHSKFLGFFILYLLKPICVFYAIAIVIIEIIKNNGKGEKTSEV